MAKQKQLFFSKPAISEFENFLTLRCTFRFPDIETELVGFRHIDDESDFTGIDKYLTQKRFEKVQGQIIEGDLENLDGPNGCTEEFVRIFEEASGIVFCGGDDPPGELFGRKTHPKAKVTAPTRNRFEVSFLKHLLVGNEATENRPLLDRNPNMLILCICLGMQELNIALGGGIVQDIPIEIYHDRSERDAIARPKSSYHNNPLHSIDPDNHPDPGLVHEILLDSASFFGAEENGQTIPVYSRHHQGITKAASALSPTAWSMDRRIVEAVVHRKYPNVYGVQFHPEKRNLLCNETPVPPVYQVPFKRFHRLFWHHMSRLV